MQPAEKPESNTYSHIAARNMLAGITLLMAISVPVNYHLITSEISKVKALLARAPPSAEIEQIKPELDTVESRLWIFVILDILVTIAFAVLWIKADRHPLAAPLLALLIYVGLWVGCWLLGVHGSLLVRLFFFIALSYSAYRASGSTK